MASFTIPTQTRAIDPYQSYDSELTNGLTRIISNGNDIISKGMDVSISDSTSVLVASGTCIKDDVMINITDNVTIDLLDSSWFVEGTAASLDTTGYIYVVVDYTYLKSKTPNTASYKILKTTTPPINSRYMFIKAIGLDVSGDIPVIDALYDYDPDNTSVARQTSTLNVTIVDELPPWSISYLGLMYMLRDGSLIAIGTDTQWIYFPADSTSKILAEIYEEDVDTTSFSLVDDLYEYDINHSLNKSSIVIQLYSLDSVNGTSLISPDSVILTDDNNCKIKLQTVPYDVRVIITG